MKTILKTSIAAMVVFAIGMTSCRKTEDPVPTDTNGNLKVKFTYVFGSSALPWELNKQMVHPKTGDTLTFTNFKFYVSNVKLKRADGIWWAMPESYFLVDAKATESSTITIPDVPKADYVAMEYVMGVDSARNVSGANTGALALTNGMFWDWNSGYIMVKAEGYSPNSPTNAFAFHLGGFSGDNNIVTTKSAEFGKSVTIGNGNNPTATITANPARLWHTSPNLSVRSVIHMPGAEAKVMAKDFYDNISFTGIQ